ncbi:HAD family hydrolase [Crocosphaera chwakensis]|nr:HAD family hydrolase [Crocosphaera chwakensis]
MTLTFSNVAMAQNLSGDPLPSWNEGTNKQTIINFVESIIDPENPNYVAPFLRIATFDNDGTLWAEKPMYFQAAFALSRIRELAPQFPEWKEKQPFKAVLENDQKYLANITVNELLEIAMMTHAGTSQKEFEQEAKEFLNTAKHPRFNQLYKQVIYQPMLELLIYLQNNQFKTYICSGGGLDFIRLFSEEAYNIEPENVIGSNILKKYQIVSNYSQFIRQPQLIEPINDKAGKPVNIERFIGKKPILAVGNSDGDIEMMQYTVIDHQPSLALLLHHDDEIREYRYTKGTEKALELAKQYRWSVISMKQDFKQVFSFTP